MRPGLHVSCYVGMLTCFLTPAPRDEDSSVKVSKAVKVALLPHIFDPVAYISLYCLPLILLNVQQIVKITCRNNDNSRTAPFLFQTKALPLQRCAAPAEEKFQRRVQLNSP